jgi:hypothetical protein
MCRKFTLIFTTNFVGLLEIRASREVFQLGSGALKSAINSGAWPQPFPGAFLITPARLVVADCL